MCGVQPDDATRQVVQVLTRWCLTFQQLPVDLSRPYYGLEIKIKEPREMLYVLARKALGAQSVYPTTSALFHQSCVVNAYRSRYHQIAY